MDHPIDIAVLAHAADIPADDPGIHQFSSIRRACADVCAGGNQTAMQTM